MRILVLTALGIAILAPTCDAQIFSKARARREARRNTVEVETRYEYEPAVCTGPNCRAAQRASYQPSYSQWAPATVAPPAATPAVEPETPTVEATSTSDRITAADLHQLPIIRVTIVDRNGGPDREATIDLSEFVQIIAKN